MKPRHAAALALVGWYLISPPLYGTHAEKVDPKAPFSKWVIVGKYDTIQDCESDLDAMKSNETLPSDPINKRTEIILFENTQCIASDDPRLKGK